MSVKFFLQKLKKAARKLDKLRGKVSEQMNKMMDWLKIFRLSYDFSFLKGAAFLCFLVFLSSCVSEKQGKESADCAPGEKFDSVSRNCRSIRTPPSPALDSLVFDEDAVETFTVNYRDLDSLNASRCQITVGSGPFEIRAPEYDSSPSEANSTYTKAFDAASSISDPALRSSALAEASDAYEGVLEANAAETSSAMSSALYTVYTNTIDAANIAITSNETVAMSKGQEALESAKKLESIKGRLDDRCSCDGGVCQAEFVGDENQFGSGGFSYTLTDNDGTSREQNVSVVVKSVNDAPLPFFDHFTFSEPSPLPNFVDDTKTFSITPAYDVEDLLSSQFFEYQIKSLPEKGTLSGCLGLPGSSNSHDLSCVYKIDPAYTDDSDIGTKAQQTDISGMVITAKAPGEWGDGISIEIKENPISRKGNPNGTDNVEIEVDGLDITVWIETDTEGSYTPTTVGNVVDALNASSSPSSYLIDAAVDTGNGHSSGDDASLVARTFLPDGSNGTSGTATSVFDEFTYTVNDGTSDGQVEGVVAIDVTPTDDPPTPETFNASIDEDTIETVTFDVHDPDDTPVDSCTLSSFSSELIQHSPCSCSGLQCEVDISGTFDFDSGSGGTQQFNYDVTVDGQSFNSPQNLNVTVNGSNDAPLVYHFNAQDDNTGTDFSENNGSQTKDYNFTVPQAYEAEGEDLTYEITSQPNPSTVGEVSECMNNDSDRSCVFTPVDGNVNGVGGNGSLTYQGVLYSADFDGAASSQIEIQLVDAYGISAGDEEVHAEFNGGTGALQITVYIDGGNTTSNDIVNKINNDTTYVKDLITASVSASQTQSDSGGFQTLSSGGDGLGTFTYKATDDSGNTSFEGVVNINMTPTNDVPVICQVSEFEEEPKCGLGGCIKNQSPMGYIKPSSEGVTFYDRSSGICYESNGTSSNTDWEIVSSSISDVTINERSTIEVKDIYLEEGGPGEDGQTLRIDNVSSSDTTLIPVNKISFDSGWNTGTAPFTAPEFNVGDGGNSADDNEFQITLEPASSQTGKTTISFDLHDSSGDTTSVSFDVSVNGASVTHGGWKNLMALGPKISTLPSRQEKIEAPTVCPHSRYECRDGGSGEIVDCKGGGDPDGQIEPLQSNVVYHDSDSGNCYYSTGTSTSDWSVFSKPLYCHISSTVEEPGCSGASCLEDSSGTPSSTPSKEGSSLYNVADNECWRSVDDGGLQWVRYKAASEVKIGWEDFSVSGSGSISGYNVYRRVAGGKFDYSKPLNKEEIKDVKNSYVDNAVNSWRAPIPKTAYEYEVKPVVNDVPTQSQESTVVRLLSPPKNMAFVHRWMVNKSTCEIMNRAPDTGDHYSCEYHGPSHDSGRFDIGKDLLVDRFEAACNYSRSPVCSTSYGDCVGAFNPNDEGITANDPDLPAADQSKAVFYDRSSGTCYETTDGSTWNPVTSNFAVNDHREPHNPPLVNISQDESKNFCQGLNETQISGYNSSLSYDLPDRFQQMAYSHWNYEELSNSEVSTLETGFALNSSPKCNSSEADGLDDLYSNSDTVTSNNAFTIPGTTSSGIRSIETGSEETEFCESLFGIQDVVGNVAEWTKTGLDCRGLASDSLLGYSQCEASPVISASGSSGFSNFFIDGNVGPCRDIDADGFCDESLQSWRIDNESFNAGRWVVPLGLPIDNDYPTTFSGDDDIIDDLLEIGPSSGIVSSQLHEDEVTFNTAEIFANPTGEGHMATGGNYLSNQGAGRWNFEFLPERKRDNLTVDIGDVTFTSETGDVESIDIRDTGSLDCSLSGTQMVVEINSGSHSWTQVRNEVNSNSNCNSDVSASGGSGVNATVTNPYISFLPGFVQIGQIALRVKSEAIIDVEVAEVGGASDCSISSGRLFIDYTAGSDWDDVLTDVNTDSDCNQHVEVYKSGNVGLSAQETSSSVPVESATSFGSRENVGFRCVSPVDVSNYK